MSALSPLLGDKAPLRRAMTEKYRLKPYAYDELVALPFCGLCVPLQLGRDVGPHQIAPVRLPRRGRQRRDVRDADAPVSRGARSCRETRSEPGKRPLISATYRDLKQK